MPNPKVTSDDDLETRGFKFLLPVQHSPLTYFTHPTITEHTIEVYSLLMGKIPQKLDNICKYLPLFVQIAIMCISVIILGLMLPRWALTIVLLIMIPPNNSRTSPQHHHIHSIWFSYLHTHHYIYLVVEGVKENSRSTRL